MEEEMMRIEELGIVVVDVKGDELRSLYERRAALVQKDIGRLEEQMGLARKQLEGRREELEHMLQRNPAPVHMPHHHGHGLHGGMDLDHLAMAVEAAKRSHEHALFMAAHVAPGKTYRLTSQVVASLLGADGFHGYAHHPGAMIPGIA